MPPTLAQPLHAEAARAELHAVLESPLFTRSPGLAHLLSYLCEKLLSGESEQVKEYSVAVDVFGRPDSFDQDSDSIVRVQANRLRKRLAEYYAMDGANHTIRIAIPVGQYVPVFEEHAESEPERVASPKTDDQAATHSNRVYQPVFLVLAVLLLFLATLGVIRILRPKAVPSSSPQSPSWQSALSPPVGLPVGNELRILVGSSRSYVDRSGKLWNPDEHFTGGTPVRSSVQHIWRTQDATIYRTSRQGEFRYDIPLTSGIYELHLHFAETFYGPEDAGGGEGSRLMNVSANGKPLLTDFDVVADAEARTADVKAFSDIAPAADGLLHLSFSSANGSGAILSGIELLPAEAGRIRPIRIVARDVPYYSNDSHWFSADVYFKGGQMRASDQAARDTEDPELYETERWGRFSYALPVVPGKYALSLHFIERRSLNPLMSQEQPKDSAFRVFSVFCNGRTILRDVNITREVGEDRPLIKKVNGLTANAQGKLVLEFIPTNHYATLAALELRPE